MPFESSDEFIWTVDLIPNLIHAKKHLRLPKALKAFPESWIKVYWVVIAPSGNEEY